MRTPSAAPMPDLKVEVDCFHRPWMQTFRDLCAAIEKLGASPEQTEAITLAVDIHYAVAMKLWHDRKLVEVAQKIADQAIAGGLQIVPDRPEHIAWMRWKGGNDGRQSTLHICDSDSEGAFKVYREPPPNIIRLTLPPAESAADRVMLAAGEIPAHIALPTNDELRHDIERESLCTKHTPIRGFSTLQQHPEATVINRAPHWDGSDWEQWQCPHCHSLFAVKEKK